ncbi:MAG TPA: DUF2752 domain-containing protein [Pirellulales bacterium]|nr:DUF2752 domain-containing protein [Pirellulales bacterium]
MTQSVQIGPDRFSVRRRLLLAVAGVCWLAPLVVAGCLRPDPNGLGTHQQLGLPPCTFVWLFGMRCPSCGMTTSWAHAARGNWTAALASNSGGALLAGVAALAGPWLVVSAARGRWLTRPPSERALVGASLGVVVVTLIDWICRLSFGR